MGIQNHAFDEDKTFKRDKKGKKIEVKHNDQPPPPPNVQQKKTENIKSHTPLSLPQCVQKYETQKQENRATRSTHPLLSPSRPFFHNKKALPQIKTKKKARVVVFNFPHTRIKFINNVFFSPTLFQTN